MPLRFDEIKAALADRYAIEREVGQGGMAIVYLAKDLKHERQVAIKVLKPDLAAVIGAERFLAEIKTTANLQHPHILPLFDSGQAGSFLFFVMPFVEGESLDDKLDREKQFPVAEAVRIASEVADALEYAHGRGVIHRDIKPANILLHEGRALVADFGIALAVSAASGTRLTETGLSVGTPQYMSPEQATGDRELDGRSDLYSLGCITYEMLAGEPPHTGPTAQAVFAKILADDPRPLTELRRSVRPHVAAAVHTALEKLPADRFADPGAFRRALLDEGFREATTGWTRTADRPNTWKRLAIGGLATTAILVGLAAWGWLRPAEDSLRALVRGLLEVPVEVRVPPNGGFQLSPDGRALAYVAVDADGVSRIWIQPLGAREARPLEGTEGASDPFWSPDAQDLGFFAEGNLKRVSAAGGAVTVLALVVSSNGGTWSADDRIVYTPHYNSGLFEISAGGGDPRPLTELDTVDGEKSHRWPRFLPDGRALLFLVQTDEYGARDDRSRIEVLDAEGNRHEVMRVNSSATYAAPGELLYWREGALYASEFDPQGFGVSGTPRVVAENVAFDGGEQAMVSVSTEGTLVYQGAAPPWRFEWRDRAGRLLAVEGPEGDYDHAELSPDGLRVVYKEGFATLWVLDLDRGTRTILTFEEDDHRSPTWSPDGDWIAYSADRTSAQGGDIYRRRSSGAGERESLYGTEAATIRDLTWSPDGRRIVFNMSQDLHLLDLDSGETRVVVATPGDDSDASVSPDGRWLAFSSDESGRPEVYVVAVDEPTEQWVISQRGGFEPQWGASGDELFFFGLDYELRVVTVEPGARLDFGPPEPLFKISGSGDGHRFQVAPDGRVLVRTNSSVSNAQNFQMILNWPELLKQPDR